MERKSLSLYVVSALAFSFLVSSCGGSGGGGSSAGNILVRMSSLYGEGQILGSGPGEQVGLTLLNEDNSRAAIWHDSTANPVKVGLGAFKVMMLFDTDGTTRVGRALADTTGTSPEPWHAILTQGAAATVTDLHPAGYYSSEADAVEGGTQVGWGTPTKEGQNQPLMWHGSAASVVDLLPAGAYSGKAQAILGGVEAGQVRFSEATKGHAGTWHGTADSFTDLHPAGYQSSAIYGMSATDMVGAVVPDGVVNDPNQPPVAHAFRWAGNARTDLNPAGAFASWANATNGSVQVGYYSPDRFDGGLGRACLWRGTASSFVDLHALLPAGYGHSRAMTIDGKIISGWASDADYTHVVPVIWELR